MAVWMCGCMFVWLYGWAAGWASDKLTAEKLSVTPSMVVIISSQPLTSPSYSLSYTKFTVASCVVRTTTSAVPVSTTRGGFYSIILANTGDAFVG